LKKRRATVAFFDALADSGCTSLITSELKTSLMDRRFQLEEFLSHGVVLLHTLFHEGNVVRAVQIEKMRGISHDTQIRPYQFGVTGIEVKLVRPYLKSTRLNSSHVSISYAVFCLNKK